MNLAEFYSRARALAPSGRTVIVSVVAQSPAREPEGTPEDPPRVSWEVWVSPGPGEEKGTRAESATPESVLAFIAKVFTVPPAYVPPVTDEGLTVKP